MYDHSFGQAVMLIQYAVEFQTHGGRQRAKESIEIGKPIGKLSILSQRFWIVVRKRINLVIPQWAGQRQSPRLGIKRFGKRRISRKANEFVFRLLSLCLLRGRETNEFIGGEKSLNFPVAPCEHE